MVYKRQLFFQYSRPSGCDTSKLLSDDLKNELYYDGFQKMLYHYSHQEKPVHFVYWFFFFGAKEDLKKAAAQCAASKAPVGFCLACGFQPVGTSTGRTAAKIENPNLFSIGEGFGFFVSG